MLIDINTYVGHWPFRQLRNNSLQGIVRSMDRNAIDRAVTASIHGIFYKNVHPANQELAKQAKRYPDRIHPYAVINPLDADWEEDFRRSVEDLGMQGLRIFPQYHGYRLTDSPAIELVDAACGIGWPIQVPMRVVDRRQRHPHDWAADISADDITSALAKRPDAFWMILDALGLNGAELPDNGNYLVDISRMTAVLQRNMQTFMASAGHGHLAFGTGMPFKMAEPTLLKLEVLDSDQTVRDMIAWKNADTMLSNGRAT